jgi:hypothetical protein
MTAAQTAMRRMKERRRERRRPKRRWSPRRWAASAPPYELGYVSVTVCVLSV